MLFPLIDGRPAEPKGNGNDANPHLFGGKLLDGLDTLPARTHEYYCNSRAEIPRLVTRSGPGVIR